jgi:hypothetical protein
MSIIEDFQNKAVQPTVEELFDINGLATQKDDKVFAKMVNIDLGNNKKQIRYFIRTYNNIPLDPLGPEGKRDIWSRTELKIVSEKTFKYYLVYLRTKNSLYMTRTQRSFING